MLIFLQPIIARHQTNTLMIKIAIKLLVELQKEVILKYWSIRYTKFDGPKNDEIVLFSKNNLS